MGRFPRRHRVRFRHMLAAGAGSALLAGGLGALPAHAALGSTSAVVSNNQVSSASSYTFTFTTGTPGVTDLIAFVPSGADLSSLTAAVSTAATCTGTFAAATLGTVVTQTSNNSVGIPVTGGIAASGTCVRVVLSNVLNPSAVGATTACIGEGTALLANLTLTNLGNLACGLSGITGSVLSLITDTAATTITYVAKVVNGTTAQLDVAPVLTVSAPSSASFTITPSGSGVLASASTTTLNVATNAAAYQVQGQVMGLSSALSDVTGSTSIPLSFTSGDDGSNAPASCPSNGVGTAFGTSGASSYVALPVGGSPSIAGLTNSKNTVVNYCWKVDLTKPAGSYTATINYLVVPAF